MNFDSRLIQGTKSYSESLQTHYVGSASGIEAEGGAFGATDAYQHIENFTEFGQNIFIQSDVSCCIYDTEVRFMS